MGLLTRARSGLPEPPRTTRELAGFPTKAATGDRFRAHHADFGPWWFATVPAGADPNEYGRFDLSGSRGSCYVANDVEAAVRERLGPRAGEHSWLPADGLDGSTVSVLKTGHRPRRRSPLANTRSRRATAFLTREISTTLDYALTHRWARAWDRLGLSGVRYDPRLSAGAGLFAEAWFGPSGAKSLPSIRVENWRTRLRSPIVGTVRIDRAEILD